MVAPLIRGAVALALKVAAKKTVNKAVKKKTKAATKKAAKRNRKGQISLDQRRVEARKNPGKSTTKTVGSKLSSSNPRNLAVKKAAKRKK